MKYKDLSFSELLIELHTLFYDLDVFQGSKIEAQSLVIEELKKRVLYSSV